MGGECVTCGGQQKAYKELMWKSEGKELRRPKGKWQNVILIDIKRIRWEGVD